MGLADNLGLFRFGVFELDVRAGEMYKHGHRIRLQEQPFRVLSVLLERAGTVVTREELHEALWPADTFVDFEHGLNNAIRRLREVLGDSADNPRFIETVPRRGYRFIAPSSSLAKTGSICIESVVVLPFENLTGDASQGYFADGFTDALISNLAQIGALRVISRTSAMRYKLSQKSLPEIARELHVQAVVEGSVMRCGERVRITAQLIHAASDRHLWSEVYERSVADILDLQRELAHTIAQELEVQLTSNELAKLTSSRSVSPAAYEAYVKGRYYWNRRTYAGLHKAIELFQKAVHYDESYAAPHAGLADCYNMLAYWGLLSPIEACSRAKAAASQAIALDNGLAEAWAALAWPKFTYEWNWDAAAHDLRRAEDLNNSYITTHQWWTHFHAYRCEHEETESKLKLTLRLDPVSYVMHSNAALMYSMMRRFPESIEYARTAIDLDPSFAPSYYWLGVSLLAVGDQDQAISAFENAVNLSSDAPVMIAGLAHALAYSNRREQAHGLLERLRKLAEHRYVSAYYFALIHAGLDEGADALACIDQGLKEHSAWLVKAAADYRLDNLRRYSSFKEMLRLLGLSPESATRLTSPSTKLQMRAQGTSS